MKCSVRISDSIMWTQGWRLGVSDVPRESSTDASARRDDTNDLNESEAKKGPRDESISVVLSASSILDENKNHESDSRRAVMSRVSRGSLQKRSRRRQIGHSGNLLERLSRDARFFFLSKTTRSKNRSQLAGRLNPVEVCASLFFEKSTTSSSLSLEIFQSLPIWMDLSCELARDRLTRALGSHRSPHKNPGRALRLSGAQRGARARRLGSAALRAQSVSRALLLRAPRHGLRPRRRARRPAKSRRPLHTQGSLSLSLSKVRERERDGRAREGGAHVAPRDEEEEEEEQDDLNPDEDPQAALRGVVRQGLLRATRRERRTADSSWIYNSRWC